MRVSFSLNVIMFRRFLMLVFLAVAGLWLLRGPERSSTGGAQAEPSFPPVGDLAGLVEEWTRLADAPEAQTQLLRAYRQQLLQQMQSDPLAFLENAPSLSTYVKLPWELQAVVARPYSGLGEMRVAWSTSLQADGSLVCTHRNRFQTDTETLEVLHPDGRSLPVRALKALSGYRLGNRLLIQEEVVQRLSPEEAAAAAQLFPEGNPDGIDPVTGRPVMEVAALVGGRLYRFSEPAIPELVEEELQRGNAQIFDRMGGNSGGGSGGGASQATPYQANRISVLFIRVDFSDFPGEPVSKAALESSLASVNSKIDAYSYGQAGIRYTVSDSVYRMPFSGAAYAQDFIYNDNLQSDARSLASATYTLTEYDVIAVFFPSLAAVPVSEITYGGFADIGSRVDGSALWINGLNNVEIMLHEFGHNYGLYHANYLDPEMTLGVQADYDLPGILEYGDIFDTMGDGNSPEAHFNPLAKNQLQWIPDSKIAEAAADGTWRIYRFDDANALSNATLALKVPMAGEVNYWVGYRQLYTSSAYNLANAAYVVGENMGEGRETVLIDMTPDSQALAADDRKDAGLPVGGSYYDAAAGVTFAAVANGGVPPHQWIDVQISFDPRIGFSNTLVEVDEQAGTAEVLVSRRFSSEGAVSVAYQSSDGTATAPADYYAVSGTLNWADGDDADKSILIPIRPDSLNEGIEDLTLTLSNVSGGVLDPEASSLTVSLLDPGQRYRSFAPPFFNTSVNAVLPLANGQVMIGGDIGAGIGDQSAIRHIARLNADGSVDSSFVSGSGFDQEVEVMVRQADGQLLVAGPFTQYNGSACPGLVRLSANGLLDTAFVTNLGTGPNNEIKALALEADGGILVGGNFSAFNGVAAEGLIRLNPDGTRNTVSPLNLPFDATWNTEIFCLLVEEDGKMMVGGSLTVGWTGSGFKSGILRLNPDGTEDSSFDPDAGTHAEGSVGSLRRVYSIQQQPDGKYLISGPFTAYDENPARYVARISESGAFDSGFTPPVFDDFPRSGVLQANNALVLTGNFTQPARGVERLGPSGAADATFYQQSGVSFNAANPDVVRVFALAGDAEGQLWLGGNFFSYQGLTTRPVIRLAGGVSPYQLWVREHFSATQIANGDADPAADPDMDDLVNLVELAMGGNPIQADAGLLFGVDAGSGAVLVEDGGNQYLQISLAKSGSGGGFWLGAQFSGDLSTWSPLNPVPDHPAFRVIENSATRFTVRDTVPISPAAPRFGRVVLMQAD